MIECAFTCEFVNIANNEIKYHSTNYTVLCSLIKSLLATWVFIEFAMLRYQGHDLFCIFSFVLFNSVATYKLVPLVE